MCFIPWRSSALLAGRLFRAENVGKALSIWRQMFVWQPGPFAPSSAAVTGLTTGPCGAGVMRVGVACVVCATTAEELVVAAGGAGADAQDATSSAAARRAGTDRIDMAGAYAGGHRTLVAHL